MFNWFKNTFKTKTRQQIIEEYLAESTSLQDLERRERDLERRGLYY